MQGVKKGRIRMGLSPSGKWALEVECWNPEYEDLETQDDFFEDLDPEDNNHAQLRVKGYWELGMGFITFRVNTIEEVRASPAAARRVPST